MRFLVDRGYELVEQLNGLTYSQIRIAKKNGEFFVLKSSLNAEHFGNELRFATCDFESERVLRPLRIECGETAEEIAIVYPLLASVANRFSTLRRLEKLKIISDVSEAVSSMHAAGFYHGDVKLQNILSTRSNALVCDFGTTRPLQERPELLRAAISNHQPPDKRWSSAVDVYALGVLLYQAFYGLDFISDYVFNGFNFPSCRTTEIQPEVEDALKRVIKTATDPNPNNRCSLDEFKGSFNECRSTLVRA